jgi:hypothetical protein
MMMTTTDEGVPQRHETSRSSLNRSELTVGGADRGRRKRGRRCRCCTLGASGPQPARATGAWVPATGGATLTCGERLCMHASASLRVVPPML